MADEMRRSVSCNVIKVEDEGGGKETELLKAERMQDDVTRL